MDSHLTRRIPRDWQSAIDRLKNLPELTWLMECRTDEQREHWRDCREFCQILKNLLNDYFSGNASDLSQLSKDERTYWTLHRDRWIALYNLIQQAWFDILQAVQEHGLQADFPNQSGEMLILMLKMWAAEMFSPCVIGVHPELGRFSPRKAHTAYLNRNKPIALPENLTLEEWRKRFSKADREMMTFSVHETFCLLVCEQVAKKDRLLKDKLKTFRRIEADIEQINYAMIHPRKKVQGYQWVNGRKERLV
ncbi:hypothetical protein NC981_09275 [Leptolyngbya sp. DQ-M1]|uniref:hypothetical protein n=1 Tax=Leptolyngbya sp. DQ-M1 TaxID=2933920 RepID=UPI00329A059D